MSDVSELPILVEVANKMRSFALSELLELSLEPVNVLLFLAIVNGPRKLIVFYRPRYLPALAINPFFTN